MAGSDNRNFSIDGGPNTAILLSAGAFHHQNGVREIIRGIQP